MRPLSAGQVRELLSGAAASAFFEVWARIDRDRTETREEIDDLSSQIVAAESRVKACEQAAADAEELAESLQMQVIENPPKPDVASFADREVAALARAHTRRAARALEEAGERRRRALQMAERVASLRQALDTEDSERESLREKARELGAYAGESCLFFSDAEHEGGAFLVPLHPLHLDGVQLDAFVVYRLPAGSELEGAEAIRDAWAQENADAFGGDDDPSNIRRSAPVPAVDEDEDEDEDPFATPSEHAGALSRRARKKEKS